MPTDTTPSTTGAFHVVVEDASAIADRLAALDIFKNVPREQLEFAAQRGDLRRYDIDTMVRPKGETISEMFVILDGRVALRMPKGGSIRTILVAGAGTILGLIPYSRFKTAPGNLLVEKEVLAFSLHEQHFPDLIRECQGMIEALVHYMLDRARQFRTAELNDERLQSLGRLASGLAHELNNPAAGAARSAHALDALIADGESAARALAAARLSDEQLAVVDRLRSTCSRPAPALGALEAADREDDIAEWLERNGIDASAAEALAGCAVTMDELAQLADSVPQETVKVAVRWIACGNAARSAAQQIENATRRIHDLVGSVKGFTFMDREGVPEDLDIAQCLRNTLAVLENKFRARSVKLEVETAPDLPRVFGYGSEINQVFEKVIDNAIDAAGPNGVVQVTATWRGDEILVRVADNGPGIPEDIRNRVFDPFFTTKPVGQGTGLGLDIARRLADQNRGSVDFITQPGRTVFRVRLPVKS